MSNYEPVDRGTESPDWLERFGNWPGWYVVAIAAPLIAVWYISR